MTSALQADEKACPFCAETIKKAAIVCRFCNRDLATEAKAPAIEASPEERANALGITRSEDRWVFQGSYFKDINAAIRYAENPTTAAPAPVVAPAPKSVKWWLWGPVALVVTIFVFGAMNGPKTYADLAAMETQSCIRSKGDGHWRASMGVTLETFCRTAGNIEARRELCKSHPEAC